MIITKKTIEAKIFSLKKHMHQEYESGVPYSIHLIMVSNYINKYINLIPQNDWENVICAGWLHDVREDVGVSYNDIKKLFGYEVAEITYNLTNNDGRNRKEKAINTYIPKISTNRLSVFCKLADRLANVQYGLLNKNNSMLKTQANELDYMVETLFVKGEYDNMWNELSNMLNKPIPNYNDNNYNYKGLEYSKK